MAIRNGVPKNEYMVAVYIRLQSKPETYTYALTAVPLSSTFYYIMVIFSTHGGTMLIATWFTFLERRISTSQNKNSRAEQNRAERSKAGQNRAAYLVVAAVAVGPQTKQKHRHSLVPGLGRVHEGRHAVPTGEVDVGAVVRQQSRRHVLILGRIGEGRGREKGGAGEGWGKKTTILYYRDEKKNNNRQSITMQYKKIRFEAVL